MTEHPKAERHITGAHLAERVRGLGRHRAAIAHAAHEHVRRHYATAEGETTTPPPAAHPEEPRR